MTIEIDTFLNKVIMFIERELQYITFYISFLRKKDKFKNYKAYALHDAIYKKWIPIREGLEEDKGSENCKLCHLFGSLTCSECPIVKIHGPECAFCYYTPYSQLRYIFIMENNKYFTRKIQKEIFFLYDLYLIYSQTKNFKRLEVIWKNLKKI